MFARNGQLLAVDGELFRVSEDEALDLARKYGTGVVGLIPFDPLEKPFLAVPQRWENRPIPTVQTVEDMPEPARVSGRDNPDYRSAVASALARLNDGELEKVVLGRLLGVDYRQEAELDPQAVFYRLLAQQPQAFVFSAKLENQDGFLMGASPELVFSSHRGQFVTHPLAGTVSRSAQAGTTDDAQLGESLMRSAKNRAEHATVVEDIRDRLADLTEELTVPAVPSLVATPQLWHLGTRITGKLKPGMSSLDGARAIHPTPAICGFPTSSALDLIRELENFERGYFGGLVGWMDADGNGEWALVLRCAEVSSRRATLFAGAGIVKGSTPANEHAETANKLGSFARALNISTASDGTSTDATAPTTRAQAAEAPSE